MKFVKWTIWRLCFIDFDLNCAGIARELKDTAGEACALLNLANCLSSRAEFAEAIPFYEQYLMLSQELSDVEGEAKACHFLGEFCTLYSIKPHE